MSRSRRREDAEELRHAADALEQQHTEPHAEVTSRRCSRTNPSASGPSTSSSSAAPSATILPPLITTSSSAIFSAVVGEAADGELAQHAIAQHAPRIVLMDIRMPNVDG